MAFVPPPMDRDFREAQVRGRADRATSSFRKPWVGAGLAAAVVALLRRARRSR